jgi:hypothetical protein
MILPVKRASSRNRKKWEIDRQYALTMNTSREIIEKLNIHAEASP